MAALTTLYHRAEMSNLASILDHGLLSTERLLVLAGLPAAARRAKLRQHRPDCVMLPNDVLIRDQKPMPPDALAPALDDGMEPADWYALLNRFVFFWPDRARLERQLGACRGRPQAALVFDGALLLQGFRACAHVSPINSGNARRRPARRCRDTLVAYTAWTEAGWQNGPQLRPKRQPPAEVLFDCAIPVRPPYLMRIERDLPARACTSNPEMSDA